MKQQEPSGLNCNARIFNPIGPPIQSTTAPTGKNNIRSIPFSAITKEQLAARGYMGKLPEFSGDASEWLTFISQFERSTLICGRGRASSVVGPLLTMPDSVDEAIEIMRQLFGRPELILKDLLEKIRTTRCIKAEDTRSIIDFSVKVNAICLTIKQGGLSQHLSNPMLVSELINKLPNILQYSWYGFKANLPPEECQLLAFNDWLKAYFAIACDMEATTDSKSANANRAKSYLNVHVEKQTEKQCPACGEKCLKVEDCQTFAEYSVEDRWECVKKNHLCFRCLKSHNYWFCKEKRNCSVKDCGKKHHRLLHEEQEKVELVADINVHNSDLKTLFRILPVKLYFKDNCIEVLAFIDEGSSTTLIESDLLKKIGAEGEIVPLCLKWTGNICRTELESMKVEYLQISAVNSTERFYLQTVRSVKKLELPLQELSKTEIERYSHTSKLPITPYSRSRPKILIGLNNAQIATTLSLCEGRLDEPIAARTRIGWTLYGPSSFKSVPPSSFSAHICEGDLHNLVKEHFNLESIGVVRSEKSSIPSSEKRAISLLDSFTKRIGDRFESGLLWKYSSAVIPNSFPMAKKRFDCLEKRLSTDPVLRDAMQKQIEDYMQKGYIHKVKDQELSESKKKIWYLPIFPVFNPNKPGKTRIVWDAAAQTNGISLNSLLLKGPDQTSSLIGVLFRFREFKVAVCGDIEQMFHRILMRKEDQDCQRFLWRSSYESQPSIYRMSVLTFGASCSPSTAQFVKNRNADEFKSTFPDAASAIFKNHYVDDYLDSFPNLEKAKKVCHDVSFVHSKGGFRIRNWLSNYTELLDGLDGRNGSADKNITVLCDGLDKVLGMWWSTSNDSFTYSVNLEKKLFIQCPTKREVLRTLMSVFDPLGLIAHVLVFGKVLLKKIWRSGVEWDQTITSEHLEMWRKWINTIESLRSLKIPRCHFNIIEPKQVQLHILVDASKDAYAAVAYFRATFDGNTECSLVLAKSRVSPLKEISIPRLELQAAVLGVRMAKLLVDEHRLRIKSTTFWTDSKTVLSWIRNSELRLKQFVSFRVGEILETTENKQWKYVNTKSNTADLATKWSAVPNLIQHSEWFRGPSFLYQAENTWPEDVVCETSEEVVNIHGHCEYISTDPIAFRKFGNWNRILRGIAVVLRAIQRFKRKVYNRGPLSSSELQEARRTIYRLVQREVFPEEISEIIENGYNVKISKASPLRKVCPFLDEYGVLRSNSRLSEGNVDYDLKYPVVLPKDHHITHLIVHYFHVRYHHANRETVINELRQKYYVSKIRVLTNTIRNRCQMCKINNARPNPPMMSALPPARISLETRPFTFIGVDLFGPLLVVTGRNVSKRWGMLFTCLTVRAVHMEVVHSLTTDSCILGLMRFMSIRGCPRQIYSDNGTNFKGASNEIKDFMKNLDKDMLQRTFNSVTTEWLFIPPASPHMGGSWERMVQSVKNTLNKIKPKRNPSDEMLLTMLAQACNIVNSRPLTYVAVDEKSPEAITPNHLLLGSSAGVKPMGVMTDDGAQLWRNWKYVEWFANKFWERFRTEYLPELCCRDKWSNRVEPIKEDDIVYIIDNNTPRNEWPKGRVIEVFKGRNDQVRSCVVQTEKGILTRPAVRLAVLQVRGRCIQEDHIPGGSVGNTNFSRE